MSLQQAFLSSVIDVAPLVMRNGTNSCGEQIGAACRKCGFFYVVGHGVDSLCRN